MPSSVIDKIDYDKDLQILKVTFRSGAVYHYLHVADEVYIFFMKSKFKGNFLNKYIKDFYEFERVD